MWGTPYVSCPPTPAAPHTPPSFLSFPLFLTHCFAPLLPLPFSLLPPPFSDALGWECYFFSRVSPLCFGFAFASRCSGFFFCTLRGSPFVLACFQLAWQALPPRPGTCPYLSPPHTHTHACPSGYRTVQTAGRGRDAFCSGILCVCCLPAPEYLLSLVFSIAAERGLGVVLSLSLSLSSLLSFSLHFVQRCCGVHPLCELPPPLPLQPPSPPYPVRVVAYRIVLLFLQFVARFGGDKRTIRHWKTTMPFPFPP